MEAITRILTAIEKGNAQAAEELLPVVYEELRRLAAQRLSHEKPGQTLQPPELVHEAYLRLVKPGGHGWDGRAHFFAAAAEAMRRILVDRARRKGRLKRGGDRQRVGLTNVAAAISNEQADELLALDEALTKLAEEDAVKAELVTLRYFAGLKVDEAAAILGISRATADRYWSFARAWLYHEITKGNTRDLGGSGHGT